MTATTHPTPPRRRRPRGGRGDEGSTLVEFALVAPIVFMLILGIIAGCYLAYQNSALHDGATAGSRAASIETSLAALSPTNAAWTPGSTTGLYCESGLPAPIEKTVAGNAPLLTVNPAPLCASSSTATQLTQTPVVAGDVNITVTCGGTCAAPTSTAVALTFATKGIAEPLGITFTMSATSKVPVLSP